MGGQEVGEAGLGDGGVVLALDLLDGADLDAAVLQGHGAVAHALVDLVAGGDLGDQHAVVHLAVPVLLDVLGHVLTVEGAHCAGVDAEEGCAREGDVHGQHRDARCAEDVHDGLANGRVNVHVDHEFRAAQRQALRVGDGGLAVGVVVRVQQLPAAALAGVLEAHLDQLAEYALLVDVRKGDGVSLSQCRAQRQHKHQYQYH